MCLKMQWTDQYEACSKRDLYWEQFVSIWVHRIHTNVRLDDEANSRQCLLVLMGANVDGQKHLSAVTDGYQESKRSWTELLLDLKHRGLKIDPKLAVGNALGFWAALREVFPTTREHRCWVHKTANVLNKLPRSIEPKAKADLHEIWQASTRGAAAKAFDHFLTKYGAKYDQACVILKKDRDALLVSGHLKTGHSGAPQNQPADWYEKGWVWTG